jgi:endonuclease/exonuclease/phosphatase family metal-dependent hydrolase
MSDLPYLSFLSWNLAMLERSAQAPPTWGEEHTQAAVRDVVLDLSPDIVLFQELPGVVPYVETHEMVKANPMSHSGNLATLIGHHLADEETVHTVVPRCGLLLTFVERDLTIANVHLSPSRAGADERLTQLEAIIEASPTADLVVIGDTNTRTSEEQEIATLGLTGERPPRHTWDGRRNRFRGSTGDFVAYFSRHFASPDVDVEEVAVLTDRAMEVGPHRFHLSDHFGFTGTIVTDR